MTKALLGTGLKYGGRVWQSVFVDSDDIDDGRLYVTFREVDPED